MVLPIIPLFHFSIIPIFGRIDERSDPGHCRVRRRGNRSAGGGSGEDDRNSPGSPVGGLRLPLFLPGQGETESPSIDRPGDRPEIPAGETASRMHPGERLPQFPHPEGYLGGGHSAQGVRGRRRLRPERGGEGQDRSGGIFLPQHCQAFSCRPPPLHHPRPLPRRDLRAPGVSGGPPQSPGGLGKTIRGGHHRVQTLGKSG
jgi:hypothetical protein